MRFVLALFLLFAVSFCTFAQTDEDKWVDSVFQSLDLVERIGQIVNVRANQPNQPFNKEIDRYVRDYNIGGVTFFRTDAALLLQQSNEWQSVAKTPLMVAIDAEWGLGMRLNDAISYPYQMTLGALQNDELIREMGEQIAEQCHRLGISVNFAPDVDVNNEPRNPVIGMRSFGENPEIVSEKGLKYALALQNNGILPTMKHFPGHGNTHTDSHDELPKVDRSLKDVRKIELKPFENLIDAGVQGVMVGHLYLPALEPVHNTSSSLSKNIVTDLLKKEMGFDGIIVTDGLDMKGAYSNSTADSVAFEALMAGNDILLIPADIDNSIKIIRDAAEHDPAVRDRIDESCRKVLKYKYRLGLNNYTPQSTVNLANDLNKPRYLNLKQRLYNEAVTMLRNDKTLPLVPSQSMKIAVVTVGDDNMMAKLLSSQNWTVKAYNINKDMSVEASDRLLKELKDYDYVIMNVQKTSIYASSNYGISLSTREFVKKLCKKNKSVVVNLFACPYALDLFDLGQRPAAVIVAYEDNDYAVKAVSDVILGKINPVGKLPVTINKKYKFGYGIQYQGWLTPESLPVALIDNEYTRKVDSLAMEAINRKMTPGCQIIALKDGKIIYDKTFGHYTYDCNNDVNRESIYDLASLTKIFASTFAVMKLYDEGKIDLNAKLGDFFPYLRFTDKGDIGLVEILTHQSGLPSWIPFYKTTLDDMGGENSIYRFSIDEEHNVRVAENLYVSKDYAREIFDIIKEAPMKEKKYEYSDIGFYYIPMIVEMLTNQSFEDYLEENFYKPLCLKNTFFKPLKHTEKDNIVPTEDDKTFRKQLLCGDVHDPVAALFGGVSGHAGLFSNARDLAVMMQLLLENGYANRTQFFSEETVRYFTSAPFVDNMNRRGIGFDKPEVNPDITYYTPSKQSSMESFGHTGFTGTFVWADPQNNLVVVFLSNRVCPDADNNKLSRNNIRTMIHDCFYDAVK